MARQVPTEAVFEALGRVKYPGYAADILALGIVEDAQPTPDGGYVITLRQPSAREEVLSCWPTRFTARSRTTWASPKSSSRFTRSKPSLARRPARPARGHPAHHRGRQRQGRRRQIDRRGESRGGARASRPQGRPARRRHLWAVGPDDVRRRRRAADVGRRAEFLSDRKATA